MTEENPSFGRREHPDWLLSVEKTSHGVVLTIGASSVLRRKVNLLIRDGKSFSVRPLPGGVWKLAIRD